MGPAADALIRTPDQRLRVFVSSTLEELAPERAMARAAIQRLLLTPVMFELGARPHPPAQLYRAYLEQSDVFIGVYWQRYGWVAPGETVSGLEDEFALSAGMPRLMYIKEPSDGREPRLAEMLRRLADSPDSCYRRFSTPDELAELVQADLAILLSERFAASRSSHEAVGTPQSRNTPPGLPAPLTPTIGRRCEAAAVTALIRSGARLVTITGIGGVGKTRVGTEVARALHREFDEVRLVRLGDLVDPSLVVATIAATIGVPMERSQSAVDAVATAIADDRVLLVLDNMEQLRTAGLDLAALLERCPRLHLLLTSRQVMRLRGEHEYPLAPLTVPDRPTPESPETLEHVAAQPAVALFVDHATSARPEFRLDSSNAATVAELCRRVDGLPLAIELVASRIRLLPPEALLDRLGDRLHLVAGGSADLPDRQRTIQATLDWSHQMLDLREQALFAHLGVFSGGAPLDAIEAVCGPEDVGDVVDTLTSLLEQSLVVMIEDGAGGHRVGMLETVRSYAWERLESTGKLTAARERHACWYQTLATSCDPALGPGAIDRWESLATELPNVRAAVTWLTELDDTAGLSVFASALWRWYWITGRVSEGRAWIGDLLPRTDPPAGEADSVVTARLCMATGAVRFSLGDHDGSEELLRRALLAFEAAGDAAGTGQVCLMLAAIEAAGGEQPGAIELATRAVVTARSLELDWGLAQALTFLGSLTRESGDDERGRALQFEALGLVRRIGERVLEGHVLGHIALAELRVGNHIDARSYLAEAAACCRETRQMEATARILEIGAALALMDGRSRQAAVLDSAADALRERLQTPLWPAMKAGRAQLVAALVDSLDETEYASARAEGAAADPLALLTNAAQRSPDLVAAG